MRVIFLTVVLFIAAVELIAQDRSKVCVTNRNAPPASAYYWPPDTNVKVYFQRGMFTPEQRATLFIAMEIWTEAAMETGAGVTFAYFGEVEQINNCDGCLTVTRREVHKSDRKHYAFFNPLKQSIDGLLISAWIDLDYATTKPRALQGFMVHELGHGMGLWDCKSCGKKKTIMNGFPGINEHNGLVVPSACDLEVVRQVYRLRRQIDRNVVARKK